LTYETVPEGVVGKNALLIRGVHSGTKKLASFPIPLEKGKKYTLSFYARSLAPTSGVNVALRNAKHQGGTFSGQLYAYGDLQNPQSRFDITNKWKRYHRTFDGDPAGMQILLHGSDVLFDGFQLEEGDQPTAFVSAPLEGNLVTNAPWNDIEEGKALGAAFVLSGKAGTKGAVTITVKDLYRQTVFSGKYTVELGDAGTERLALPFDPLKLGRGIFVVRADYEVAGSPVYTDYYRFSIMRNLDNTHATKDVVGANLFPAVDRGDDFMRKTMEWGFGSTTWYNPVKDCSEKYLKDYAPTTELLRKYRIANYITGVLDWGSWPRKDDTNPRDWKVVTPAQEKIIEELAYNFVKAFPPDLLKYTAFGNEDERSYLPAHELYGEYFKAQSAAVRGAKRANPAVGGAPTHGTFAYSPGGPSAAAIEGYLKAARQHGLKYDAVGIHAYGNTDVGGGTDFDDSLKQLRDCMKRYGLGPETAILVSECGNDNEASIPPWNTGWADDYSAGKPTYDFGNAELSVGARYTRLYIMALKYWPQLKCVNVWISPGFCDAMLTPTALCQGANTFGNLLPWVEYYKDVRPVAGVRGYAFKLKDGSGVVPIWTTDIEVARAEKEFPVIRAKFRQPVEFYDFCGNRRSAETDGKGMTALTLTQCPLFVKAKNLELLAEDLNNAESDDTSTNLAVRMVPGLDGVVSASLKNRVSRELSGSLEVNGKTMGYSVKPDAEELLSIPGSSQGADFGKIYTWNNMYNILPFEGRRLAKAWNMQYFYVPETSGMPDWSKIPAVPMGTRLAPDQPGDARAADLKAVYKLAWDKDNLYLRVEAEDDQFLTFPETWAEGGKSALAQLWAHDGALEVYFDSFADGRTNNVKGFDLNDYRYDFSISRTGQDGKGEVYRLREVNQQLADGLNMPTKEEAAAKIPCDFRRTAKGYEYTIVFGQRYIEPFMLQKGIVAGFGVFLHDRDRNAAGKIVYGGLSNATMLGMHCNYNPHLWPVMILK